MNSTIDPTLIPDVRGSELMAGTNRLLSASPVSDFGHHLGRYGPLPKQLSFDLVAEVADAGLRGRGGAGFPTAVKLEAVRQAAGDGRGRRRIPVVVGNGTEGEPASAKDHVLISSAPHLVLDGIVMAAAAVGADRGVLCIDRKAVSVVAAARRALSERQGRDPIPIDIAETPSRYTTGQETALISWLNGGPGKPTFSPLRPSDRGVDGRPTLLDNAETLAHLALIARFGSEAYRRVGRSDEPGTVLVTVNGAAPRRGVFEVETGTPLPQVLSWAGVETPAAALVGGYFGTWLTPGEIGSAQLSTHSLRPLGASLGCGLVAVLPEDHCPLQEVANVLNWLAASSAGQCGACVNGLPALAGAFEELAWRGDSSGGASARLDRWGPMIAGRGACKLPDGAVRFLDSSRRVFASHIEQHRLWGPCAINRTTFLPTPRPEAWR